MYAAASFLPEPVVLGTRLSRPVSFSRKAFKSTSRVFSARCEAGQFQVLQDAKTRALLAWSSANGLKSDRVVPAEFGEGFRGFAATQRVGFGDVIVSVPNKQALMATTAEPCPFSSWLSQEFWDAAPLNCRLALKVLFDKRQGTKSKWQPWIENLPEQIELPVLWNDTVLTELQYEYLATKIQQQRQEWRELHSKLQSAMLDVSNTVSWEEFYWALAAVRTRTFYGPWFATTSTDKVLLGGGLLALSTALILQKFELGLVGYLVSAAVVVGLVFWELEQARTVRRLAFLPLLDLLNHSYLANESVCFYDYGSSRHIVKSLRDYEPGEQVFMSYGSMSNDDALMFYGFLEQDNEDDCYVIPDLLQSLHRITTLPQQRLAALEDQGMLKSGLGQVAITQASGFPPQTLAALRFLLADDAVAARGPKTLAIPAGEQLEAAVTQLLVQVLQAELVGMPTSLEEDFEALQGQYIPQYKRITSQSEGARNLAIVFRMEKKKLLFRCLERLAPGGSVQLPEAQLVS